jgi:Ca2+-binding RTX toxin-like protein
MRIIRLQIIQLGNAIFAVVCDSRAPAQALSWEVLATWENLMAVFRGNARNNNYIGTSAADIFYGFAGNDTFTGGAGGDMFLGGDGIDTVSYLTARARVIASMVGPGSNIGDARGDRYNSIEILIGSIFDDILEGNAAANRLTGAGGNDILFGNGGNDTLVGGLGTNGFDGNDKLYGGAGNDFFLGIGTGNDLFDGGDGVDTVSYAGSNAGIRMRLDPPSPLPQANFAFAGQAVGDSYNSIENVIGTQFADRIVGLSEQNVTEVDEFGTPFTYTVKSKNVLDGGAGNDLLDGRWGNDVLIGGLGRDTLTGGHENDRFDFNSVAESPRGAGRDVITDFGYTQYIVIGDGTSIQVRDDDKIDLSTIDANTRVAGNQAFTFIGVNAFSGVSGQLRFSNEIVQADVNGDRVADLEIQLLDVTTLLSRDFIL